MTDEERLKWLEANQPKNVSAINAMRLKMGLDDLVSLSKAK